VELDAAAFSLPPGATSDVIQTPLGYHILRVDARTPAHRRGFTESEREIRSLLTRSKADEGVRAFVRTLLARAKVNHEVLEASGRAS
jgi:parvulin-like peptidyl-prolyl isomerase